MNFGKTMGAWRWVCAVSAALSLAAMTLSRAVANDATEQPAKPASQKTFRVMSYNIHHGEGMDGKVDLKRIAALIKVEKADIVALQEVDKGTERTARRDFPAELSELTGMTCVFSNNFSYQGGEYGNAILSRFPILQATNSHFRMLRPGEQRGILQLKLDVGGREVVLMNTHIDYRPDDSERVLNAGDILALARSLAPLPIIMCGDFNDVPESRTWKLLAEKFTDVWPWLNRAPGFTIPVGNPRKRIDYIWVSNTNAIVPLKMWVPHSTASDHLPIVGEFRLGKASGPSRQ